MRSESYYAELHKLLDTHPNDRAFRINRDVLEGAISEMTWAAEQLAALEPETVQSVAGSDVGAFEVGMAVTATSHASWWRRAWRWVTRWKPEVLTVSQIDEETGTITFRGPGS